MGYRPPKGVPPPQLQGKRTGRPRGSRNYARAWRDCLWGHEHRNDPFALPPTGAARLWQSFASRYPDALEAWLEEVGLLSGPPPVVPLSEEGEDLLAVVRHVLHKPGSEDRTHQQRNIREWKKAHPSKFLNLLMRLEREEEKREWRRQRNRRRA